MAVKTFCDRCDMEIGSEQTRYLFTIEKEPLTTDNDVNQYHICNACLPPIKSVLDERRSSNTQKMPYKFILATGNVVSRNDQQMHYIGIGRLKSLYGLREGEYEVLQKDWTYADDAIILTPRHNGDYREHLQRELDRRGWHR